MNSEDVDDLGGTRNLRHADPAAKFFLLLSEGAKTRSDAIHLLRALSDTDFVRFVRQSREETNWAQETEWIREVRLELDMRLLLKSFAP